MFLLSSDTLLKYTNENEITVQVSICIKRVVSRAGEPANFFPAPAPDFFFKRLRLRLLIFFPIGSGSCFFFKRLQGGKNTRLRPAPAPDYWLSLPKYSFPHKLVR